VIRALHLASGDLWAGAEAQVYQLLRALREQSDVRVSAITLNHGELERRLRAADIAVTVLDERTLSSRGILQGILAEIKATEATVLHTHRQKENILGSIAARLSGRAISLRTVHGRPEHAGARRRLVRAFDSLAGRLQAAIVGVSDELCHYLRTEFPSDKVFFVPNGIGSALITTAAAQPCEYRLTGPRNVGLVGRLVPVKRADLFLETAALLTRTHPGEYRFTVVGDGPLRTGLSELAGRLGIADRVDFLGFQANSLPILQQMSCLAITSDHEGLPMVVLEALALGVPIAAHAVGGLPETLAGIPGQSLVSDHSPAGYAAAIAALADGGGAGERRSLLPARFEISSTARQYVDLYRRLLAQHGS
jgi:glycosyltransferase involved in cell wall biosynthesis